MIRIGNLIASGKGVGGGGPNGNPSALTLTVVDDTTLGFSFTTGATNQDGTYAYYSLTELGTYTLGATIVGSGTSGTITGLTPYTTYYVKLAHYKGTKLSEYSNISNDRTNIQTPTLRYTSRSGVDILETGSGSSYNAKIIPSCGLMSTTTGVNIITSGLGSGNSSGFVEIYCYLPATGTSLELFNITNRLQTLRFLRIRWAAGKIELRIRNDSGTVFYNRINQTNASTTNAWHLVRVESTGSAYLLTIDGVNQAFTVGDGANDGKWSNLIVDADRVGIGYVSQGTVYSTHTHYIAWVNHNDQNKWYVTGIGKYEYDTVGAINGTWLGTGHIYYDINASTYLLDSGYKLYKKTGEVNEFVPTGATPIVDYTLYSTHAGSLTGYNGASSYVDFDYADSGNAALVNFKKDNSTIFIATAGMLYYDASNVYRWRQDELLDPRIYSDDYKNVGYKGKVLKKSTVTSLIPLNFTEIMVYSSDQTNINEWHLCQYCTITDLVVQSGGEATYDGNGYVIWV